MKIFSLFSKLIINIKEWMVIKSMRSSFIH